MLSAISFLRFCPRPSRQMGKISKKDTASITNAHSRAVTKIFDLSLKPILYVKKFRTYYKNFINIKIKICGDCGSILSHTCRLFFRELKEKRNLN